MQIFNFYSSLSRFWQKNSVDLQSASNFAFFVPQLVKILFFLITTLETLRQSAPKKEKALYTCVKFKFGIYFCLDILHFLKKVKILPPTMYMYKLGNFLKMSVFTLSWMDFKMKWSPVKLSPDGQVFNSLLIDIQSVNISKAVNRLRTVRQSTDLGW